MNHEKFDPNSENIEETFIGKSPAEQDERIMMKREDMPTELREALDAYGKTVAQSPEDKRVEEVRKSLGSIKNAREHVPSIDPNPEIILNAHQRQELRAAMMQAGVKVAEEQKGVGNWIKNIFG